MQLQRLQLVDLHMFECRQGAEVLGHVICGATEHDVPACRISVLRVGASEARCSRDMETALSAAQRKLVTESYSQHSQDVGRKTACLSSRVSTYRYSVQHTAGTTTGTRQVGFEQQPQIEA